MKMPANKVPVRQKWQALRDKSGGKKNLAKVSIGKSLDSFHAAAEKAARSGDVAVVSKAMAALEKDVKAYIAAISKKKELNELTSTVKRELLSPLQTYGKSFEQMAAAGTKEINKVEVHIKNVTGLAMKEGDKLKKTLDAMNKEMAGMTRKYANGVPAGEKADVMRFLKEVGAKIKQAQKGVKSLDGALNEVVSKHAREHRPLIDKHNATLGKAKKTVKDTGDEAKRATGYMQVLATSMKKG